MRIIIPLLAVLSSIMLLTSCSGLIQSTVTVSHQLQTTPEPTSYSLYRFDEQGKVLVDTAYKNLIRQKLAKYKYTEVLIDKNPDVIICFGVRTANGRMNLSTPPAPGQPDIFSGTYREYSRVLWLTMVDVKTAGSGKFSVLYGAQVNSSGMESQLPKVMPAMINALFNEFPGHSGQTRREIVAAQ